MKCTIVIAAHKPYRMPEDPLYLPLQVGSAGKESIGFTRDDTGDNLSAKNPCFCELTALYWAWKNLDADYIGLAHYRRHFATHRTRDPFDGLLTEAQAQQYLEKAPVLLPKPQNYYITNLYDHYADTHDAHQLQVCRAILADRCPDYLPAFDRLHKRTSAHMFNMLLMRRDLLDSYCTWLFPILFAMEEQIDTTVLSAFEARLFGRVSELLLDVWLETNRVAFTEVPVVYTEKINWFKKIGGFLSSRLFHKKYGASFR